MEKLISVIIPVYNVQEYLERCVRSVVYQTYKNLEIILVDDGSTDKSGTMCDEFQKKYNRIAVIHKQNGGLSDARNAGMVFAKGDYIAFLDSDDYIHHQMYEILVQQLEYHDADIAECAYKKVWKYNTDFCYESAWVKIMNAEEAILANYRWEHFTSVVCNKVFKRDLIVNMRFPVGKIHEDEFFTYKALFAAKKLVHVGLPMYYYQQRAGSIIGAGISLKSLCAIEAYKERLIFFENNTEIYKRGFEHLLKQIHDRLFCLAVYDKRPMKEWKVIFDAYTREILSLDHNMLLKVRPKMRRSLYLMRFSKTLYRWKYVFLHRKRKKSPEKLSPS